MSQLNLFGAQKPALEFSGLASYDLVIVNTSGGKDSQCAAWEVCRMAKAEGFPLERVVASHQDLGRMEWFGVKSLVGEQSSFLGIRTEYERRVTADGIEETLLDYVRRRKMWPSSKARYCTSDFKRGPGAKVATRLAKEFGAKRILYVFGFRAEESPARAKRKAISVNKKMTNGRKVVHDYLPIHEWSTKSVWSLIKSTGMPYHWAYDLGMPRLSCVFCIFAPFDALVLAGKHNPELLAEYVEVEREIGHRFRVDVSLKEVQEAVINGHEPRKISNWVM